MKRRFNISINFLAEIILYIEEAQIRLTKELLQVVEIMEEDGSIKPLIEKMIIDISSGVILFSIF